MVRRKIVPSVEFLLFDEETGESNQELRNYDIMWGDGDIHCKKCGAFVRMFDRD